LRVGVIGLQGDIEEHLAALAECGAEPVWVRSVEGLEGLHALVIPGGESTTICALMQESGVFEKVEALGARGMPIWGTCAGMILLARKGDGQVRKTGQKLLGLMDMEVERNAFGRQRESFETELDVGKVRKFPAVFIRAPAAKKVGKKCRVLARFGKRIVAVEQGNLLATAFHPELSGDRRLHKYFLAKAGQ